MNKINIKINKYYFVITLLLTQGSFAANFNIVPFGTLPTTVSEGQTVVANFTLTNMTHTARNGYTIAGLPATVTQNSTSPNCSNPINLAANAHCNLKLDITGAVSSHFSICNGNNCTQAETPLNVSLSSTPSAPQFAYITNLNENSPYVSLCALDAISGNITSCDTAGGDSVFSNAGGLAGIVLNNNGTMAYMTNAGTRDKVYQCTINQSTKQFDTCTSTTITNPEYQPQYGQLALNHSNAIAYIVSSINNKVFACPIESGVIINPCVDTGASGAPEGLIQITLNQDDTVAYIGTFYNGVLKCSVNGTTFSQCNLITGDGNITFLNPTGVALNRDGTKIYVAEDYNAARTVYICSTTMNGSNFSSCTVAFSPFSNALWSITLNASNTVAYINNDSFVDNNNTTYTCQISGVDGTFSSCSVSTLAPAPTSTALLY